MTPFSPSPELRRLVDGMTDGRLRRPEVARLEELLEADPAAMDYYLAIAGQEGLLRVALEERLMVEGLMVDGGEARGLEKGALGGDGEGGRRRRWRAVSMAAVVAVIAIAGWVAFERPGKIPGGGNPGGLAASLVMDFPDAGQLASTMGVVWESPPLPLGKKLAAGAAPLVFRAGLMEVVHASGTRLLLEGPASYQVTGPNAGKLHHGRLVAEVPRGAEGYTVECADGRIVDLGTEFALQVPEGAGPTEVGVFRGEVEVMPGHAPGEPAAPLYTGHAVRMGAESSTGLISIPFDKDRFTRRLPEREFPWFYDGGSAAMEWNVSPLIRGAGDFIAIVKWMSGPTALTLSRMELLLDGTVVSTDDHPASIGHLSSTVTNLYRLSVPAAAWRRGTWTLRAWPADPETDGPSEGILLMEDGAATTVTAADFTGSWDYVHDGERYRRTFHPDGTCLLEINGRPSAYFNQATWHVEKGVLRVSFAATHLVEEHLLRDRDSLIFVNQPYRNARRVPEPSP